MFLKIKKAVSLSAGLVFVAALFAHGNLENSYIGYPREPAQESGRVIPHLVKGGIVYITEDQYNFLRLLGWIELISGIIFLLVLLIHWGDPFKSKNPQ
jgi:hypothetical protein